MIYVLSIVVIIFKTILLFEIEKIIVNVKNYWSEIDVEFDIRESNTLYLEESVHFSIFLQNSGHDL